ncbi:MAG: ribonuclease Z [Candidatus Moranbacteria bacterium]|nr:ribonuclease Z [Candidatus Moranbacteria bacterium]
MKITILGSGSFYADKERSGAAYLLEADGKKFLVDCGPGTLMRLSQIGVAPEDIDYVFLTHFHADHTSDLFAFQMRFRLNEFFGTKRNEKKPVIYGPNGIKRFTRKLSHAYQLYAFENWSDIRYETVGRKTQLGNVVVMAYKTKHAAFGVSSNAFSLRFECDGKTFVLSGDSTKDVGVEKASRRADIFICDASCAKGRASAAHMDTWEIGEIAQANGVKKVVLTHFFPNTEGIDLVSEVKEKFSGEVVRGEDFMELSV